MSEQTSETYFRQGSLEDCNLSGATLRNAQFEGVLLIRANFTGADLSGSEFYLVLGFDAVFEKASMQNVKLMGGSFKDANFVGADLTGASFLDDNLGGYIDLSGADFTGAKLDSVKFGSAAYSEETKFPTGFSPKQAGLMQIDKVDFD